MFLLRKRQGIRRLMGRWNLGREEKLPGGEQREYQNRTIMEQRPGSGRKKASLPLLVLFELVEIIGGEQADTLVAYFTSGSSTRQGAVGTSPDSIHRVEEISNLIDSRGTNTPYTRSESDISPILTIAGFCAYGP
jgi:hypothetical protein